MITCQSIKQTAKADLRAGKKFIFKASLLFFVISLILSLLITHLSGYNRFITNYNNILAEVLSDPENLANPSEDFLAELETELNAAMPKIAPAAVALIAIITLFTAMLNAGFEGYCLKVSRHEEVKVLDIMCSFEHFGKVLCILIIRTAAVFVGSMFFVVPGIIANYAFSQCFMVMYDHPEYSVFKCLAESARLMRGYKAMFFVLQLSFILWHFADQLILQMLYVAVLKVYTMPYIGISQAHFYNLIACPEIYNETRSSDNEQ